MPPATYITTHTALVRIADQAAGLRPRTLRRKLESMLVEFTPGAWMAADAVLAATAMAIAFMVSPHAGDARSHAHHISVWWAAPLHAALFVAVAHVMGLHDRVLHRSRGQLLARTLLGALLSTLVLMAAASGLYMDIGRFILALGFVFTVAGVAGSRLAVWRIARQNAERLCLLGDDAFLQEASAFMQGQARPVEIFCVSMPALADKTGSESPGALIHWARSQSMDEIVFQGDPPEAVRRMLLQGLEHGVRCSSYVQHLERYYACVPVTHIDQTWFLTADIEALHPQYVALKRIADMTLALLGLILSGPFLLLAALAIKLESRGPVFYRQTRTGLHNRPFDIYKLRTMRTDAETGGARWAERGDPRVTRTGRLLRKTRLDEVPQFFNILIGQMAFIGPRPERPEFVERLAAVIPFYRQRHLVKPGLTGWAQIHADYGGSVAGAREKLQYDLYYVKHASLEFDLHICIRTLGAMMKGAR